MLQKRTEMAFRTVKINFCNMLFLYGGDYMDRDHEHIVLADVISEYSVSLH